MRTVDRVPQSTPSARRPLFAFLTAIPIAVLGGLIGLGGAEFRLPVLAGPLGYPARRAVPLNLAVSIVTVVASLAIRSRTLALDALEPLVPAMLALIAGAVVTAFVGPSLAGRLSDALLERIILVLLVVIGCALIVEAFLPGEAPGIPADLLALRIVVGFVLGLVIGLVSSLLGVAGGELIIPTLVFVFGASIKVAGTASLFISLPTVAVGILRYLRRGAYADREDFTGTVAPMGVGSIIGAIIGGLLVGFVPAPLLKVILGIILNVSALRIFARERAGHRK